MRRLIPVLAVLFLASSVQAMDKDENWEAKKQEHFSRMKEVKLQALREKIAIMQDAAACVQSAQSHEAMRPCDERESSAMKDHQERMKQRWESLKQKQPPRHPV